MAQTHGEYPPVQSIRLDTAYCKQCASLVQEKGHKHFAQDPAKATISWTQPKETVAPAPEAITEKPEVFHTGVAEVSSINGLEW